MKICAASRRSPDHDEQRKHTKGNSRPAYYRDRRIPQDSLRPASKPSIVMATTVMTSRCIHCGHENNPQYRFCGVCGAPMGPPPVPRNPVAGERFTPPVSGPSFLGLGDDRSSDLDYLLDDEPARGHGRLYLALLLLLASAGLLAWHWQRDGYPWTAIIQRQRANSAAASSPTPLVPNPSTSAEPSAPPATSGAQPSMGTEKAEAAQAPLITANPAANPAAQADATPPSAASPTAASPAATSPDAASPNGVPPSPAAGAKSPDQTSEPKSDAGDSVAKPSSAAPPQTNARPSAGAKPRTSTQEQEGETDATESAAPKQTQVARATPMAKSLPKPQPTAPLARPDDPIVAVGERYLYGRGVRANCDLARRNLMTGAQQSNPKAQTLLGAMYATGHCVNRDLPSAYRWFAKALHGDPSNSRVQRDLEVLWKQMTPSERQLAMRSQ